MLSLVVFLFAAGFLVLMFALLITVDQETLDALVEDAKRAAVERSDVRPYFLSSAHCRVPLAGEVLRMELADASEPGKGFRCAYYTNVGYGRAARLAQLSYSRGWKEAP